MAKIGFLGQKCRYLAANASFGMSLALGMMVNFRPLERFFDFPFRSYSCFCKKIRLTCQKVFPLPTVGALSASNSPSALSAHARGLDKRVKSLRFCPQKPSDILLFEKYVCFACMRLECVSIKTEVGKVQNYLGAP